MKKEFTVFESKATPTFNIKVVVQETGLKPDTLRVWERRYGLPNPERTAGGHRLYSERDIATVKWLLERRKEGMSIGRAVALWENMTSEGQDPLRAGHLAVQDEKAPSPRIEGDTISELRQVWIDACLAFDERQAEQVLSQLFALYPPEVVSSEVLQKSLSTIGDGWYKGEITVQQEHFASSLVLRRLNSLIAASPPPSRPGRILIACPPQEEHTLGPLFLTLILRRRGWDVLYLGANVPRDRLESTLETTKPHLAIIPAQQLHTAANLLQLAYVLHREGIPLAYGGWIFNMLPGLRARIPGHFLGEKLEEAVQVVEQILASPQSYAAVPVPALRDNYKAALSHYRDQRVAIESHLWPALRRSGLSYDLLLDANNNLGNNIVAALRLGDMAFLGTNISWLEGLLDNYQHPPEHLSQYLLAYHEAATAQLDERGEPIIAWLDQIINAMQM